MKPKVIILVIVIIIIATLGIMFWRGGYNISGIITSAFPYSSQSEATGVKPSLPMQTTLTLVEKPLLEKPVPLILVFKSVISAPNTEAKIELPGSFELVSGIPIWRGNLEADEEQKIEVVIKSKTVGYYRLTGSAIFRQGESYIGQTSVIDIEIAPDDAIAGSKPENNWYEPAQGQAVPVAENNQVINSQLLISNNPEFNKEFTVTYRVIPQIDLPDPERTQMALVFPPKAFEIVEVEFPQGGEVYKSNTQLSWKGNVGRNKAVEIKATFRVINTGQGSIYGNLNVQQGSGITKFIQDAKIADLYVDKYSGSFTLK